ncbi:MAG: HlyD family efflux transporter periplasmic adaptor subunit [Candidatus Paceibacterota bacterium]|jgi:HlyD family secretion protein
MKKILNYRDSAIILIKKYPKLSIVTGLFLVYVIYYFTYGQPAVSTTYQYATVKRGSLTSIVSGTGQVVSNSQVDLKPKVNANVTGVYVKAGDKVKTGQVLFRLDATDAYKQVRDAKLSLESAQIALEKLQNPKSIDLMTLNDSIKQAEDAKKNENTKVVVAYKNLLNTGLSINPDVSYTAETAPTLSGSYLKTTEGQIKISVYQGGNTGYSFTATGIVNASGEINTVVPQPIGDSGLYIKWNSTSPVTNWVIDIPNKQSTSYSSNYTTWQNAITTRDINNAASDRTIANLKQKLADLTPGDDNLDVRSAKLTVEQKKNALEDAQYNLSNYVITAPFDGVMANVLVDIGSSAVMASSNTSSALGTIVTDKKLAQVTLNETDIPKVHLGQKAKIIFDAVDELELEGDVVEINTLGTVTSGVVTYKIKVAFSADDIRILPNMSVSVDVITSSKDNILYIPSQAVKEDANGYYVEKDELSSLPVNSTSTRIRNGTSTYSGKINSTSTGSNVSTVVVILKRVPIEIGMQNDTQTEIVRGISEGEKVVVKKTTTTSSTSSSAPSITSLFRPQSGGRATNGGNLRPQ